MAYTELNWAIKKGSEKEKMLRVKRIIETAGLFLIGFMHLLAFLAFTSSTCNAVDISDSPPEVQVKAAPPNFMFGLDDSGSMDWETLVKGVSNGYFQIKVGSSYKSFSYVLPNPGDNLYSDSSYLIPADSADICIRWDKQCLQYADVCVEEKNECVRWKNGRCTQWKKVCVRTENQCVESLDTCLETGSGFSYRAFWRSQWAGPKDPKNTNIPSITASSAYNSIYYNPNVKYEPWHGFSNANTSNPASHPNPAVSTKTINLDAEYNKRGSYSIPNAHYYVWSELEKQAFLVALTGGAYHYYRVDDNNDGIVDTNEITPITGPLPLDVQIKRDNADISYTAERQNFANWYTYHRKRWLAAVGGISHMVPKFSGVKVGIYSINGNISRPVVPAKIYDPATGQTEDESSTIINAVTSYKLRGQGTPLRTALNAIGIYFTSGNSIGTCPRATNANGGACQQNFALLFTDGYWNDSSEPGVGNQDGIAATVPAGLGIFSGTAPYSDSYSDTLADVAMKFYKNDMDTTLDNVVPKNILDQATHQHMVTYTVGFGLDGTLDRSYYSTEKPDRYPTWPDVVHDTAETIDDLWHAAVNGRGKYLSAANSQELQNAFTSVVADISSRMGSAAAITMNGTEINDNLIFYQSVYSSAGWTGDLVAKTFPVDPVTNKPILRENPSNVLWKASVKLSETSPASRSIITYNDSTSLGVPFQFDKLSTQQQEKLYPSDATMDTDEKIEEAKFVLDYLRGDHSREVRFTGGVYRNRIDNETGTGARMGDVVHSAPTFLNGVVYVGANDGMLHAFSSADGRELFAYVPNHVFLNLSQLSKISYSHIPFVDSSPFVRKAGDKSYLVSGLGKGGKGVFCLDITGVGEPVGESTAAGYVKWEYPKAAGDDPDMGYSFSKPYIVKTKAEGWVAIFGNGYNSTSGKSVLYIIKIDTGAVLSKIVASSGPDNGLSTPNIVDVDADGISDYIYAGDLKGNLWKFDIKGDTKSTWGLAYGNNALFTAKDSYGNIQPITSRPDAMLPCKVGLPGYIITFGTGKWLGNTDLSDTQIQTMYGIWDYGDDMDDNEYIGAFDRTGGNNKLSNLPATVTLLKQETGWTGSHGSFTAADSVRIISDNKAIWVTEPDSAGQKPNPSSTELNNVGWYFDLPSQGERMVSDVQIRRGDLVFVSSIPSLNNPCSPEGTSWLYEINACTGGRSESSHLDVKTDGTLNDDDLITDDKLGASAVHYNTLLYPPSSAVGDDNSETKYMSTGGGNIVGMKDKGEKLGVYYWRSF